MPARMLIACRPRRRAIALVESLVASLILGVSLAGITALLYWSVNATVRTDEVGIAYNLGRQDMERVKQTGFPNTAEGTTVAYYRLDQTGTGATSAYFKLTRTVTTDLLVAGSNPPRPDDHALRRVQIKVDRVRGNVALYQTNTYLVRAGI